LKELNEPIPDVRKSNIYFHSIKWVVGNHLVTTKDWYL
jgi:hypothetical protein